MGNIGIDLGTTHSLVATVISGEARCLLDDNEEALLPSAVVYSDDGTLFELAVMLLLIMFSKILLRGFLLQ